MNRTLAEEDTQDRLDMPPEITSRNFPFLRSCEQQLDRPKITRLYDRRSDQVSMDEFEWIGI